MFCILQMAPKSGGGGAQSPEEAMDAAAENILNLVIKIKIEI